MSAAAVNVDVLRELRRLRAAVDSLGELVTGARQTEFLAVTTTNRVRHIQNAVAAQYGLRTMALLADTREMHICWPRQVAMYLCRELTPATLKAIGEKFGGRDHGTVLHAIRAVTTRLETEPAEAGAVAALRNRLEQEFKQATR